MKWTSESAEYTEEEEEEDVTEDDPETATI
jgi:hypothetical protein